MHLHCPKSYRYQCTHSQLRSWVQCKYLIFISLITCSSFGKILFYIQSQDDIKLDTLRFEFNSLPFIISMVQSVKLMCFCLYLLNIVNLTTIRLFYCTNHPTYLYWRDLLFPSLDIINNKIDPEVIPLAKICLQPRLGIPTASQKTIWKSDLFFRK